MYSLIYKLAQEIMKRLYKPLSALDFPLQLFAGNLTFQTTRYNLAYPTPLMLTCDDHNFARWAIKLPDVSIKCLLIIKCRQESNDNANVSA